MGEEEFNMPFHAAEQRNKERFNASAEQSDFPKRPLFESSTGHSAKSGTSEQDAFSLVRFFGQTKK